MIKSKKLSHFSKINHGFFNRNGGVSNGIYKSLNCGIGSNDKKINVKKNLKIVNKKLGSKSKEILPEWFKELPFDSEAMEATILDQKIDNLIGVLGWDVQSTETTNTFNKLFEF